MRRSRSAFFAMFGLAAALEPARCCCGPSCPDAEATVIEDRAVALPSTQKGCPVKVAGTRGLWELEATGAPSGKAATPPRALDRACVYRWKGRGAGALPDLDAFDPAEIVDASLERPVVRALAAAPPQHASLVRDARRKLEEQTDAPAAAVLPPDKVVLVGFPDTSRRPQGSEPADTIPLGESTGGTIRGNPHGFNLAWINRHLTCPGGPGGACLTSPRTALALERSGRGTRRGFADGIRRIVDDWLHSDKPQGHPLVLSIAAGWEPAYECVQRSQKLAKWHAEKPVEKGEPGREEVPFAADTPECAQLLNVLTAQGLLVLEELQFAACHGALIVAAAGNDPLTTPQRKGPMLPAAWETRAAPDPATCRRLGVSSPAVSAAPYQPLVYAASGVNDNDTPIVLTRAGGISRVVAPASLLAAFPEDSGTGGYRAACGTAGGELCDRSYPMTGTSVAAAVVSAAAAAVWAYNPAWDAHEVMKVVHASGERLDVEPSFDLRTGALGGSPDRVSRISICRAIKAALGSRELPAGACQDRGSGVVAWNGGARPAAPYAALAGRVPFDDAPSATMVDPQPSWPCPACKVIGPPVPHDDWEITGQIMADAWDILGASDLQVSDEPGSTGGPTPHVVLLDAQNVLLAGPSESGFSAGGAPHRGSDARWTSMRTDQEVRGYFKFTGTAPAPAVEHVVVFFQQYQNGRWSSAAQEIPIVRGP